MEGITLFTWLLILIPMPITVVLAAISYVRSKKETT
jgi:hypothetical protein